MCKCSLRGFIAKRALSKLQYKLMWESQKQEHWKQYLNSSCAMASQLAREWNFRKHFPPLLSGSEGLPAVWVSETWNVARNFDFKGSWCLMRKFPVLGDALLCFTTVLVTSVRSSLWNLASPRQELDRETFKGICAFALDKPNAWSKWSQYSPLQHLTAAPKLNYLIFILQGMSCGH